MSTVKELSELLFIKCQKELTVTAKKVSAGRKKALTNNIEQGLDRIYNEAREQRIKHKLGVIKRARVAFELQNRLLNAGYSPALVKQIVFSLLINSLTGK